ncbi:hypothetical protein ABEB36_011191 [Hypothenemus hampei]|uniref:DUF4773 domain-containing protein n=1 Tax=Hypothenemus hampei TaxID=57062 RepID=A0ABD1EGI1_HYPHA
MVIIELYCFKLIEKENGTRIKILRGSENIESNCILMSWTYCMYYCLNIQVIPNELTLNVDFSVNGESVYNGKIDPSSAPVCPTPVPLCLTVNHVDVGSRQICTKITLGPLTLLKFPCFGISDGQIFIEENAFVRK